MPCAVLGRKFHSISPEDERRFWGQMQSQDHFREKLTQKGRPVSMNSASLLVMLQFHKRLSLASSVHLHFYEPKLSLPHLVLDA